MKAVLGIVGGSGIYELPALSDLEILTVKSPWGETSAPLKRGRIGKTEIVFLPRHGIGHFIPPSEINYRANIDALKRAGVTDLISLSACGSLRDDFAPGTFVLVDQFIDQTRDRHSSFFGTGCVAHVSMADPVSPNLVQRLENAALSLGIPIQRGATCLVMEGPQFSTRAESHLYRKLGIDVIGMTVMPEAKLAREAELTYALLAMVTDYDCWHEAQKTVDAHHVLSVMKRNVDGAQNILTQLAKDFPLEHELCPSGTDRGLDQAIVTAPEARDPVLLKKLDSILSRVLSQG